MADDPTDVETPEPEVPLMIGDAIRGARVSMSPDGTIVVTPWGPGRVVVHHDYEEGR